MKLSVPLAIRRQLWPAYYFAQAALRAPKIREFDRRVTRGSALGAHGYIRYPRVPEPLLDRARPLLANRKVVVDDESIPIISYLVNLVRNDVVSYLGPDVRIDNILTRWIDGGASVDISGSWHEDGVGHRLKLFFCIEGYGDVPTAVIPGTSRRKYFPKFRDFYRFKGVDNFDVEDDQVLLKHFSGDCVLFDTNGRHRGVYDRDHRARGAMEIEFADRHKSNHFSGKAAIGPGNAGAPRFSIQRHLADAMAKELLLDSGLLKEESDSLYLYG